MRFRHHYNEMFEHIDDQITWEKILRSGYDVTVKFSRKIMSFYYKIRFCDKTKMSDFSDFSDSSDDGEDTQSEGIFISDSGTSDVDDDDTSVHSLQPLETEWSSSLDHTQTPPFLCDVGPSHNLLQSDTERNFFN